MDVLDDTGGRDLVVALHAQGAQVVDRTREDRVDGGVAGADPGRAPPPLAATLREVGVTGQERVTDVCRSLCLLVDSEWAPEQACVPPFLRPELDPK